MEIFNLGVYELKKTETDLKTSFVEYISDAKMKLAPVGFLYILEFQYMIGSVFSVSVILKTKNSLFSSIIWSQLLLALP